MNESQAFSMLHRDIQRWIVKQDWDNLREIQERATEHVLAANCDVIISAATASGKTEAAFLPACSFMISHQQPGIRILYVSPLKALINDQYRRLQSLCDMIDVPLTPWHGDVSQSLKNKQSKSPSGIILITPESLESLLLNKKGWSAGAFANLNHVIIDEFHSFIGSERGCQLLSLLHRLEFLVERTIPRIALSATLGDMQRVVDYLRPTQGKTIYPCEIIDSTALRSDVQIQLRGYINPATLKSENRQASSQICDDLYRMFRNQSNLIFANSRAKTEEIAVRLSDQCKHNHVPNEFFVHHGSLAKEIREELEARLQKDEIPTTAVCTVTLELGIDIGNVDSIAQITAPHSVAGLRQRLGRSGRRDKPSVLRLFIAENELTSQSPVADKLRIETMQSIAMVNLLLNKWYEPPEINQYHFSTLVQQTLSVIGQYGGVRADQLWRLLCATGPFRNVDQSLYTKFLKSLGQNHLITQMQNGEIVLGDKGERVVEHYTFYTAFMTPEEFRLEYDGHTIGTIPCSSPLAPGDCIIFAGRKWKINGIDLEKKRITLQHAVAGNPPHFDDMGMRTVHDAVRQEMRRIFIQREQPVYLNTTAKDLFNEGITYFHELGLANKNMESFGNVLYLFPWLGDKISSTITMLLKYHGIAADLRAGIIEITKTTPTELMNTISEILRAAKPTHEELANSLPYTALEKHDCFLTRELCNLNYGIKNFDIDAAIHWLQIISNSTAPKFS